MAKRDGWSDYSFVVALESQGADATTNGADVNTQGYETVTFVANVGTVSSITSTTSNWLLRVQHADASGATAGTYADVVASMLIRDSSAAFTSGTWVDINLSSLDSAIYSVGYRGPKQYVRVVAEDVGNLSVAQLSVLAILGLPGIGAVNVQG